MAVSRLSQQSLQNAFPKGNTVWDGTTATSAFDSLGSVYLTASTGTITFSSIPQTYTHIQLRVFSRDARAETNDALYVQVNGDSTSGRYVSHGMSGYSASMRMSATIR